MLTRVAACFMLARVRTPSSWTNFSALPTLFTGQREVKRERERKRDRNIYIERKTERER